MLCFCLSLSKILICTVKHTYPQYETVKIYESNSGRKSSASYATKAQQASYTWSAGLSQLNYIIAKIDAGECHSFVPANLIWMQSTKCMMSVDSCLSGVLTLRK